LAGEDVPTIYQVGLVTRDGKRRDFEIAIAIVPDTAPVRMVTIGIDITERKRIEDEQNAREMEYRKKIHHQANYDSLTGLPNRELFRDHMEHAIKHLRNEKDSLALLFIDIDGFKMVNDIGGHHLGDQLSRFRKFGHWDKWKGYSSTAM
jgi:predicted signal transduction protein with EAL and GGDEF domain